MKKLSLKRKHPQDKSDIKRNKTEQNIVSNDCDNNKFISSTSLGNKERVIIKTEQREGEVTNGRTQHIEKKSAFLNTGNPSLDKLREMLISLTPKTNTLSPFPQICDHHLKVEHENSNYIVSSKGKPLLSSDVREVVGLSPFPKVCPHYRASRDKVVTSCKLRTCSPSYKEENENKDMTCNMEQTGSSEKRIPQNKMGESQSTKKGSDTFTYRENNCNLLRDRNSNIYSLQSQNNNTCNVSRSNHNIGCKRENQSNDDLRGNRSVLPSSSKISKNDDSQSGSSFDTGSKTVSELASNRTLMNREPAPTDKPETVLLKCCPLCQTQFTDKQNQMDIDSHIASCLAVSDDNITW
ncbi:Fanconi anemia-associated protein of 20 [Mactra antiquata]